MSSPFYRSRLMSEALELHESGLSPRGVADELRTRHGSAPSHETIREWVHKFGSPRSRSRAMELRMARQIGKDYDAIRAEARRLAEEELWSVKRIADHLGVAKSLVRRAIADEHLLDLGEAILRRCWQAFLPDVEVRRARRDAVLKLRERGWTYPQIAAATGVSEAMISVYLRRAGMTKPTRRWPRNQAENRRENFR